MAAVKFTLDPGHPPKLSAVERERLDAQTQDEIDCAAETDFENPPLSDVELERAIFTRSRHQKAPRDP
ncbi:hypothetical protein [Beijerinckia sp. L45]|uniref:hypothetical protein n=1 Tax=Beijerinckia sp. L45 TaxID=1641855 RepID=UPI00131A8899|nr:hypothetical protein [Beijerinckia sp. L45]